MLQQLGATIFKADPGTNSARGISALKFKVVGAGTTTLTLLYANAPENGSPSIYSNSFGLTITAR